MFPIKAMGAKAINRFTLDAYSGCNWNAAKAWYLAQQVKKDCGYVERQKLDLHGALRMGDI